jgi:hypothetical protein
MVHRTYGRYIPNLTRQDGSAFEKQYVKMTTREEEKNQAQFRSQSAKIMP